MMEDNQLVPKVKNLLFSTTTSDAIEAAALLGIAEKFGISDTSSGVQLALFQVLHKDESIKNNVTEVYKESLFGKDDDRKKITPREKAIREVTRLIGKLKAMQPGQSPALASMIASWKENNTIGNEHFKVVILVNNFYCNKSINNNNFHLYSGNVGALRDEENKRDFIGQQSCSDDTDDDWREGTKRPDGEHRSVDRGRPGSTREGRSSLGEGHVQGPLAIQRNQWIR